MADSTAVEVADPIKVGVIADQTGPLSFVGLANANVARMVIDDLNAAGGLLERQLVLVLEDSATDDAVAAAAKAAKLVGRRRSRVRSSTKRRRFTSTLSSTKDRSPIR
jgi:ABC-type branched-subunit amino acid transport system substrate-binding protein